MQRVLASTNLENETLKSLLGGEQELREDRSVEQTHAFLVVNEDVKQHFLMSEEEKRKAKRQREVAESAVLSFERTVTESKARVTELVAQIDQVKLSNKEALGKVDVDLKTILGENRQLKLTKDKQESNHKLLERDVH